MRQAKSLFALALLLGSLGWNAWSVEAPAKDKPNGAAGPSRVDRFGDPLPEPAIARMGSSFLRHERPIHDLAFSADGKVLACAEDAGMVLVWNLGKARRLSAVDRQNMEGCIALSPDGTLLATVSLTGGDVNLWNARTGQAVSSLQAQSAVKSLLFAPDGKTLAAGTSNGDIYLWALPAGPLRVQLRRHKDTVSALAFSHDGRQLASGGEDKTVCLWDLPAGTLSKRLTGYEEPVRFLAFCPDAKRLVSVGGSADSLLNFPERNGRLEVKSWDAATDQIKNELPDKYFGSYPAVASPDGAMIACVGDHERIVLRNAGGPVSQSWHAHRIEVKTLAYSSDGKMLASGGMDDIIRLWDSATGKEVARREGHESGINAVGFLPGGQAILSTSGDGTARVWETRTGKQIRSIATKCDLRFWGGAPLAMVPGTQRFLAGREEVNLFDAGSGEVVNRIGLGGFSFTSPVMSANGRLVAMADFAGRVRIVEVKTGNLVQSLNLADKHERHPAFLLALSPDGNLLASTKALDLNGNNSFSVRLTDTATGKEIRSLEAGQLSCLLFSPDGKTLATAGHNQTIRLLQVATGKESHTFHAEDSVTSLAFAADGKMLASGSLRGPVNLWEVSTGQERARFEGHIGGVTSVAFSPDGRMMVSGSGDTTIVAWDIMSPNTNHAAKHDFDQAWADLQAPDAHQAFVAMREFMARPEEAVPYLGGVLHPVATVSTERAATLIADLDDSSFKVRKQAAQDLAALGEAAAPALRQALEAKPSLEARQRIEQLLQQLDPVRAPQRLRVLRAIETLEYLGTPEVKRLLAELARGASYARQTDEAREAVRRLGAR